MLLVSSVSPFVIVVVVVVVELRLLLQSRWQKCEWVSNIFGIIMWWIHLEQTFYAKVYVHTYRSRIRECCRLAPLDVHIHNTPQMLYNDVRGRGLRSKGATIWANWVWSSM